MCGEKSGQITLAQIPAEEEPCEETARLRTRFCSYTLRKLSCDYCQISCRFLKVTLRIHKTKKKVVTIDN